MVKCKAKLHPKMHTAKEEGRGEDFASSLTSCSAVCILGYNFALHFALQVRLLLDTPFLHKIS